MISMALNHWILAHQYLVTCISRILCKGSRSVSWYLSWTIRHQQVTKIFLPKIFLAKVKTPVFLAKVKTPVSHSFVQKESGEYSDEISSVGFCFKISSTAVSGRNPFQMTDLCFWHNLLLSIAGNLFPT